jgi:DNA-directed RNA polymerase subunit RPC12/RpoP
MSVKKNKGQLLCDTCGSDNHFETNDDKTYVKCHACGREYFGGYNELLELNKANIEERAKAEGKKIVEDKLKDILKKLK